MNTKEHVPVVIETRPVFTLQKLTDNNYFTFFSISAPTAVDHLTQVLLYKVKKNNTFSIQYFRPFRTVSSLSLLSLHHLQRSMSLLTQKRCFFPNFLLSGTLFSYLCRYIQSKNELKKIVPYIIKTFFFVFQLRN